MITCTLCKKTSPLKSYKGCCSSTTKMISSYIINENGCWLMKTKNRTIHLYGIDINLKVFVWKTLKPEPKRTYDNSFKIKNICAEANCCHPLHITDKLPPRYTSCRYCHLPYTQTKPKMQKNGQPYPFCMKCYYLNHMKTTYKKCRKCKKKLDNERLDYCNLLCKFESHIKKDKNNCWLWKGACRNNHPTFSVSTQSPIRAAKKWAFHIFQNSDLKPMEKIGIKSCPYATLCVNPHHTSLVMDFDQIKEAKELYEINWSIADISRKINIDANTIRRYVTLDLTLEDTDDDIKNYLICKQCQSEHQNRGSDFCSQTCILEYLN